jgi:hypothetical protein
LAELEQPAGVAHALGRLRLLEVGEQLADVAQLATPVAPMPRATRPLVPKRLARTGIL